MTPDIDGDGILDGQEVYGYQVTVMWYVGKEMMSRNFTVTGCPRVGGAHKAGSVLTLRVDPLDSAKLGFWWIEEVLSAAGWVFARFDVYKQVHG